MNSIRSIQLTQATFVLASISILISLDWTGAVREGGFQPCYALLPNSGMMVASRGMGRWLWSHLWTGSLNSNIGSKGPVWPQRCLTYHCIGKPYLYIIDMIFCLELKQTFSLPQVVMKGNTMNVTMILLNIVFCFLFFVPIYILWKSPRYKYITSKSCQ